jgi:transposase InsO family protein
VHKNKQLIVKFACGATRQTSVNRLQTIPLPDYIAALSLPDFAAATMEIGLQQQLRVAQDCDRETQELLHWKDTPLHKQRLLADVWKFNITLHDDIIITDPTNKLVYFKSDKSAQPRLVIPAELRQAYCKLAHSSVLLGAHRDVESTRLLLEPLVYWPDMLHDMKTFQKSCHTCQTHAYPRQLVNTPVGSLSAFKPLQRLSIDHIGPFPKNDSGMKYLLVVIDHFTKYVWVFATPDNNAHTTALLLWKHIFCIFGAPEEIHTDGASTLLSEELGQLYTLFGIQPLHSTAYYPQGNGVVERANGSVKKIIAKTITELTTVSWSESAPAAGYAYNQALHRSTGFAPFFLMFGRDVKTPLDVLLTSDNTSPSVTPLTDYLLHLLRSIRTSHRVVTDSLLAEDKARIASNSAHTPGKAQTISYEIGDLVLWTNLLPDIDEMVPYMERTIHYHGQIWINHLRTEHVSQPW